MILKGRGVSGGVTDNYAKKVKERISFLGDVDPSTGRLYIDDSDISDAILVFPGGRGSTVGSYVIYQLKKSGHAPSAIINQRTETIVATGAIISDIPLVDNIDISLITTGDHIVVDGDKGTVEMMDVKSNPVVTVFLRKNGKILLVKRGEDVGSYRGKWSAISGYLEDNSPVEQAHREVLEETGLTAELLAQGQPLSVRYADVIWEINPFLFEVESDNEVELNWENTEYRWVSPEKIKELDTVPKLWDAYISTE